MTPQTDVTVKRPERVMVGIIADGLENASTKGKVR